MPIPGFKIFKSLTIRGYRLYFSALMGQTVAMSMQSMARGLLMYRLTGSIAMVGVLYLAGAIPEILMSLLGGVLADRLPKKYVMMAGQASYLLTSLFVALALTTGLLSQERELSWIILVAVTALRGVVVGLVAPSRSAILTELVGRDLLMNALSLRSMGRNVMRLLIPGLAGWLIDVSGFAAVYYAMTATYAWSLFSTYFLPVTTAVNRERQKAVEEMKDGLRYIRHDRNLLLILALAILIPILTMPYLQLMPVFVDDILQVGATGMGILISASAAGAIVGSALLASLPSRRRGLMLIITGLILGLAVLGFAASSWWYGSLALMVFIGVGSANRMTLTNTLLQSYASDRYRGRVLSIYAMETGLTSFGGFLAAMLAETVGAPLAVGSLSLLLVAILVITLVFSPRLRRLE